ncbi:hypothetical protein Bca4012_043104 [Brassica carinata]
MFGNTKDKIVVCNNAATCQTFTRYISTFQASERSSFGFSFESHRNAFRFISIGVSVEILRRKQVGLFLACFHSLRSDLSDLHSLHSDLSGLIKASERSSFRFSFESSSKRFSFRLNRSFR